MVPYIEYIRFGADTTELRFQNELNQRKFAKQLGEFAPQVIIEDCYDKFDGFRLKLLIPSDFIDTYLCWLLSTDWYNTSSLLNLLVKHQKQRVKNIINDSLLKYSDKWDDDKISGILNEKN